MTRRRANSGCLYVVLIDTVMLIIVLAIDNPDVITIWFIGQIIGIALFLIVLGLYDPRRR